MCVCEREMDKKPLFYEEKIRGNPIREEMEKNFSLSFISESFYFFIIICFLLQKTGNGLKNSVPESLFIYSHSVYVCYE